MEEVRVSQKNYAIFKQSEDGKWGYEYSFGPVNSSTTCVGKRKAFFSLAECKHAVRESLQTWINYYEHSLYKIEEMHELMDKLLADNSNTL
jgi:hypothetical protein